jgi:hypothetical protein
MSKPKGQTNPQKTRPIIRVGMMIRIEKRRPPNNSREPIPAESWTKGLILRKLNWLSMR